MLSRCFTASSLDSLARSLDGTLTRSPAHSTSLFNFLDSCQFFFGSHKSASRLGAQVCWQTLFSSLSLSPAFPSHLFWPILFPGLGICTTRQAEPPQKLHDRQLGGIICRSIMLSLLWTLKNKININYEARRDRPSPFTIINGARWHKQRCRGGVHHFLAFLQCQHRSASPAYRIGGRFKAGEKTAWFSLKKVIKSSLVKSTSVYEYLRNKTVNHPPLALAALRLSQCQISPQQFGYRLV